MNCTKPLLFGLLLTAIGCGSQSSKSLPGQAADEELLPTSANNVYPEGWEEIVIMANFAKTTVDSVAHFNTSRNACGKDAYGSIDGSVWNSLAKNTNIALQQPPSASDFCIPIPDDDLYLNRSGIEVTAKSETPSQPPRTLFQIKDGQICSNIANQAAAKSLLEVIRSIIVSADKEDCPNGWGS